MFVSLRFDQPTYAYLLGIYLGDGWLGRTRKGIHVLQVSQDSRYPEIVREIATAIQCVMPKHRVSIIPQGKTRCVRIQAYSKRWPLLFPQHGLGPKHERDVSLRPWQEAITRRHPRAYVRGLIHSDGCRYLANQRTAGRTYTYPRYGMSNESTHILESFCTHLDLLGIPWTKPRRNIVQIARLAGVAALDEFVGPKT
jgi:hypothetical protein